MIYKICTNYSCGLRIFIYMLIENDFIYFCILFQRKPVNKFHVKISLEFVQVPLV